jgi:formamidopyrimidine-DNA glycosylase
VPELPEVETILRSIAPLLIGRKIRSVDVRCRALRVPIARGFAAALTGRAVVGGRRRAKYLLFDLDDGRSWILHLGMSGRFLHCAKLADRVRERHDHVFVGLDDGSGIVFNDPRRFGLMTVDDAATSTLLEAIGPEPLDASAFTPRYLSALRRRTQRTIKDVLMDQRVVAGLGNIYVNELLFVAGVRPRRRLERMTTAECGRVVAATRTILEEAIEHRGSSISDFLDGVGRRGAYQWRRRVYDRAGEPCMRCQGAIKSTVIGQRSSFYCPRCQR